MLALWRPSGQPSGTHGLRLAIRDGYLNVYRLGQSVAKIQAIGGGLVADVHYKYVFGEQAGYRGPTYVRLNDDGSFWGQVKGCYQGPQTLTAWIERAKTYAGVEKKLVDALVGLNGHVIDLEMGLPAWFLNKAAIRVDLVAIEDGQIVCWEVKTVDDARIRSRVGDPHVIAQLEGYRTFLRQDTHVYRIQEAYRETARLLIKLKALSDALVPSAPLDVAITAAARADALEVAREAGLAVIALGEHDKSGSGQRAWDSWKKTHEVRLLGRAPMRVLEAPAPLVFAGAI
jgi:hypothetical protein